MPNWHLQALMDFYSVSLQVTVVIAIIAILAGRP